MKIRTYTELIQNPSFMDRFRYLKLEGSIGYETFGFDRYLNQLFYQSADWRPIRDKIIVRDEACDLGDPDHPIRGKIIIHHMNPISVEDIKNRSDILLNPEYLITTSLRTHNAIHYGDERQVQDYFIERKPNDTCPWRSLER